MQHTRHATTHAKERFCKPPEKAVSSDALVASFCLAFAWFTLMPAVELQTSTVAFGFSGAGAFAGLATTVLAGIALASMRAPFRHLGAAACALASVAGLARVLLPSIGASAVCLGIEVAAGTVLAYTWQRRFSRMPLRVVFNACAWALFAAGAAHLALFAVGSAAGISQNEHTLAQFERVALACFPVVSLAIEGFMRGGCGARGARGAHGELDELGACGMPEARGARGELGACGMPEALGARGVRGELEGREGSADDLTDRVPISLSAIFCVSSVLALFMNGFTFQPLYFSWNLVTCLTSILSVAAGAGLLAYLARQRHVALSHMNVLFAAMLAAAIIGTLLHVFNTPGLSLAARVLLDAARIYATALLVLVSCRVPSRSIRGFPALFVGSGLTWALGAGITLKAALGFDLQILAPVSSLCVAALAAAFFTMFVNGPSFVGTGAKASTAGAAGVGTGAAASTNVGAASAEGRAAEVASAGAASADATSASVCSRAPLPLPQKDSALRPLGVDSTVSPAKMNVREFRSLADTAPAATPEKTEMPTVTANLANATAGASPANQAVEPPSRAAGTEVAIASAKAVEHRDSTAAVECNTLTAMPNAATAEQGSVTEHAAEAKCTAAAGHDAETEHAAAEHHAEAEHTAGAERNTGFEHTAEAGRSAEVARPTKAARSFETERESVQRAAELVFNTREEVLCAWGLSKRERQVSLLVIDGMTAQAAADELGISISTVKFHLTNSYRKLGIQSKLELVQLVKHAMEAGIDEQR